MWLTVCLQGHVVVRVSVLEQGPIAPRPTIESRLLLDDEFDMLDSPRDIIRAASKSVHSNGSLDTVRLCFAVSDTGIGMTQAQMVYAYMH